MEGNIFTRIVKFWAKAKRKDANVKIKQLTTIVNFLPALSTSKPVWNVCDKFLKIDKNKIKICVPAIIYEIKPPIRADETNNSLLEQLSWKYVFNWSKAPEIIPNILYF